MMFVLALPAAWPLPRCARAVRAPLLGGMFYAGAGLKEWGVGRAVKAGPDARTAACASGETPRGLSSGQLGEPPSRACQQSRRVRCNDVTTGAPPRRSSGPAGRMRESVLTAAHRPALA